MAAAANPFDLDKKKKGGLPQKEYKARTYTDEEKAEMLTGYMEIPEDIWSFVRYGTHVRYITKAGEFRPGGFVTKNPFDTKVKGSTTEKRFIKMQNSFFVKTAGHSEWIVAYEDIGHLYAKPDASALAVQRMLENAVTGLNSNIKNLANYVKKLEKRVDSLEGGR